MLSVLAWGPLASLSRSLGMSEPGQQGEPGDHVGFMQRNGVKMWSFAVSDRNPLVSAYLCCSETPAIFFEYIVYVCHVLYIPHLWTPPDKPLIQ